MTQSDWQRVRDRQANEHSDKFADIDAKREEGELYIEKRFSSFCYGWDASRAHTISEILESAEMRSIEEFIRRAEGFMFEVTQPDQGDEFAEFDEAMRPVKTALALLRKKMRA